MYDPFIDMSYFYFAATLPDLSFSREPPMSHETFVNLCREHLSERDIAAVEALGPSNGDTSNSFVRGWKTLDIQLRNALARTRALVLGRDPNPCIREHGDFDTSIEKIVSDAYTRDTPRDREIAIDRFRWAQAESLSGYDAFSIDAILAYAVKLKLVERWANINKDTGRSTAEDLVAQAQVFTPDIGEM